VLTVRGSREIIIVLPYLKLIKTPTQCGSFPSVNVLFPSPSPLTFRQRTLLVGSRKRSFNLDHVAVLVILFFPLLSKGALR
jgi:hypothetical protein